jgi:NADP-dependent 3-hydroxy acid dehydrogenase YdfG
VKTLRDKIIIVTGAGGSVAGAVQEALARSGARPALVDRDLIRIQGRAASYNACAVESDLGTLDEACRVVAEVKARSGRVDGLIHLVGEVVTGRVEDLSVEDFQLAFDTNVRTLFTMLKAVLPELHAHDEAFVGGIAAHEAWGGGAAGSGLFAASKSAVAALLRSLDRELEDSGITVGIVFPMGAVDSVTTRRRLSAAGDVPMIHPRAIGNAFVAAALADDGGRMVELPVYPPRRGAKA